MTIFFQQYNIAFNIKCTFETFLVLVKKNICKKPKNVTLSYYSYDHHPSIDSLNLLPVSKLVLSPPPISHAKQSFTGARPIS